jgi:hypothetical protein
MIVTNRYAQIPAFDILRHQIVLLLNGRFHAHSFHLRVESLNY